MFSETQFSVLFSSNTLLCYRLHALMFPSLERIQAKTKQSATHSILPITGSVYWSGLEQCILLVVRLIPLQLKGMPQPFFTFCQYKHIKHPYTKKTGSDFLKTATLQWPFLIFRCIYQASIKYYLQSVQSPQIYSLGWVNLLILATNNSISHVSPITSWAVLLWWKKQYTYYKRTSMLSALTLYFQTTMFLCSLFLMVF